MPLTLIPLMVVLHALLAGRQLFGKKAPREPPEDDQQQIYDG
jgi:hypothetical protein